MARPFTCPYCSSMHTIWKGYRIVLKGKVRLRLCKECGRKFTTNKYKNDGGHTK